MQYQRGILEVKSLVKDKLAEMEVNVDFQWTQRVNLANELTWEERKSQTCALTVVAKVGSGEFIMQKIRVWGAASLFSACYY